jgi:hypothetical protein
MAYGPTETNLYQTATNAASQIIGGLLAGSSHITEKAMLEMFDRVRDHIVDDLFTVRQAELDKERKPKGVQTPCQAVPTGPGFTVVPQRVPNIGGLRVSEVVELHPARAHWACTVGSTQTRWIAQLREYVRQQGIDVDTLKS